MGTKRELSSATHHHSGHHILFSKVGQNGNQVLCGPKETASVKYIERYEVVAVIKQEIVCAICGDVNSKSICWQVAIETEPQVIVAE